MKLKKKRSYANSDGHPATLLHRMDSDSSESYVWLGFTTEENGFETEGVWTDQGESRYGPDYNLHRVRTDRAAKEGKLCVFWDSGHIDNARAVGIMALSGNESYPFRQLGVASWRRCATIKQYLRAVKEQAK